MCEYVQNKYSIIKNNAENDYGTDILVKNTLQIQDVSFDTEGRVIMLNTGNISIINIYPKAGTDAESRRQREELLANTVPNMSKYIKNNIIMGGDWNSIIECPDCTDFAEQKISPSLKRLIKMLKLQDAYRII